MFCMYPMNSFSSRLQDCCCLPPPPENRIFEAINHTIGYVDSANRSKVNTHKKSRRENKVKN